jgi:hypothetical protein
MLSLSKHIRVQPGPTITGEEGVMDKRKASTKPWTGSTEGPHVHDWPRSWYRHPREHDCHHAPCGDGEDLVVELGDELRNVFVHFWSTVYRGHCRCGGEHERLTWDLKRPHGHVQGFGLFKTPEGPANGELPIRVACRDCIRRMWEASERYLDGLDAKAFEE